MAYVGRARIETAARARARSHMPRVALIPECVECERPWVPADEERWQARLAIEEHIEEVPELVFYCPECAEREFGG